MMKSRFYSTKTGWVKTQVIAFVFTESHHSELSISASKPECKSVTESKAESEEKENPFPGPSGISTPDGSGRQHKRGRRDTIASTCKVH